MRSIATAVESYAVDFGRPAIGHYEGRREHNTTQGGCWDPADPNLGVHMAYRQMTTPVAYITVIPRDPFWISRYDVVGASIPGYALFDYQCYSGSWIQQLGSATVSRARGYTWSLESWGPRTGNDQGMGLNGKTIWGPLLTTAPAAPAAVLNLYGGAPNQQPINLCYDATNGTISRGVIIRSNKGIYPSGDSGIKGSSS